jgi:hypothetical protein
MQVAMRLSRKMNVFISHAMLAATAVVQIYLQWRGGDY